MFVDEAQENLVTFPRGQFQKMLLLNPFQISLVAFHLLPFPFCADENVHLLGRPDVVHEGDYATITPNRDGEARFLKNLALHAVLGALSILKLASHANPFVVVLVVLLLGTMQHEASATALQVALGGLFHNFDNQIPKNLS